jgi:hypothetical protein
MRDFDLAMEDNRLGGNNMYSAYTSKQLVSIYRAGTGWIGQEGDRKRKEVELQSKLDPDYDPDQPTPPIKGEKYVFIGIALGLVLGGVLGLWLGLSINLLKPVFWIFIIAVCGALVGGIIGNYFKKKTGKKHVSGAN